MKKIAGIVIVLVVLLAGGYYGMGILTERTVKNNLAIVNQSNGLYASVVNYQRGWFKSHALLDWRVHVPERLEKDPTGKVKTIPAEDYNIEMPLTIYHGPIMWSNRKLVLGLGYAHADLVLPPKLLTQFNAHFTKESTQPKMELNLVVDYTNNTQIQMSIPQFNLIAKQGKMTFDWLGLLSVVDTTSSLSEIAGRFDINGVRFTQDSMVFTFGKVSGKYDLHKTEAGLFFGDGSTVVPSVVVKNNDEKIFELDEFSVDSTTAIEKDLFNAELKTSMDKLYSNGRSFGPGILEFGVKNLDALVLANINAQIHKAQQGSDLEKQQALLAILPEVPKLLAKGAIFEISTMKLIVPEGTIEGDVMISLPVGSLANPFELIQKIEGNGKLKLPISVVEEFVAHSLRQKLMSNSAAVGSPNPAVVDVVPEEVVKPQDKPVSEQKPSTADSMEVNTTEVESITASSTKNIDQQVAEQLSLEVDKLVQSGLLVKQGNDYRIELLLKQGQLLVNGKPFNSAMLKF